MPPFPKPKFDYSYKLTDELAALRAYERTKPGRDIPDKAADRLLLGTWNVANLGVQQRRADDYRLLAEIVSWFDIVAVQEVNDNLSGLYAIRDQLPRSYRLLFSDAAGNNERLAFIYDARKAALQEKVGEIAIPPSDLADIRLPGINQQFGGFDRNPYLASFKAGAFSFMLVNVHLYFGSESERTSINRRCLETFAVARWAYQRKRSKNAYARDIIALGDFNLPKKDETDPVYKALTRRGLKLPKHSTEVGSNLRSDKHYDQIAFFPGETGEFTGRAGVFDFDGALFAKLYQTRGKDDFMAYMRYYISDHRVMWGEFRIAP